MDDVDAVQAQIARNMLESGDWVTARLNGIPYLEKSPLMYWMIAVSFAVFGVYDWAARIPLALSTVTLCFVTARFAGWAFGRREGLYAGLILSTSIGLFLFTRVQIPDAILTLTITLAMWSLMRALEDDEKRPAFWAYLFWASLGVGLLLKGLIAVVFPVAGGVLYMFFAHRDWRRLRPFTGPLVTLAIATPWHLLATLRNPPYLDFTMHSEAGSYRGFFWFYFFNEHILRFLNLRYPRDYNTVPRTLFWAFHLLWFFPWTVFLPSAFKAGIDENTRAARTRPLCICWTGFLLAFFTLSTTQEYYSMPCYPALAMLLAWGLTKGEKWVNMGQRVVAVIAAVASLLIVAVLITVKDLRAPGDISSALTQNPEIYTLSLGHMTDLTLAAFAYLRLPLAVAGAAFAIGAVGAFRFKGTTAVLSLTVMMLLFFHAARLALITFDPYLGSRPLAEALNRAPGGTLIVDDQYYAFSSVLFYSDRKRALLLNGRVNNLEYGSYAPEAPNVFLDDAGFVRRWHGEGRYYLVTSAPALQRFERLVGKERLHLIAASGGKYLFSNDP